MADRIAVTGAGGFVGRHLVRAACRSGFDVVGIVRSEAGARSVTDSGGIVGYAQRLSASHLKECLAGAGTVVHLAQIGVEQESGTFETVNVLGTREVLAAAREAGARLLVFFSGLGVARYGLCRRTTNAYFLSKLTSEAHVFREFRDAVVFRPSYILGPGDGLSTWLLASLASGFLEQPGSGSYRLQPIAVDDAAAAVLAAIRRLAGAGEVEQHRVWDLVGPEEVAFGRFVDRLGRLAREKGLVGDYEVRQVPIPEAEGRASTSGFHGMGPEELDCLLCDEVSDPSPVRELIGRDLISLEEAMASVLAAWRA